MTESEKLNYIARVEKLARVAKNISRSFEGAHASSELPKLIALLKDSLAENEVIRAQLTAKSSLGEHNMAVTTERLFRDRDFTLIVDNSGSMKQPATVHCQIGTKWQQAYRDAFDISRMGEYDSGVFSLYLFNDTFKRYDALKPDAMEKIWLENAPKDGGTNIAAVLKDAFDKYFAHKANGTSKLHGEFIVVITDGIPDQPGGQKDLIKVIVEATTKMTADEELGVLFMQVGNEKQASDFLLRLDGNLKVEGAKFDIVDVKTSKEIEGKPLLGVLMNALND